jgi:hypothetical protein
MRFVVVTCLLLLSGCASVKQDPARAGMRAVKFGDEFSLALGESVDFTQKGVIINFNKVIEDSRCPMNVRCVWEGNARIAVEIMEFGGDSRAMDVTGSTLELNTSSRFAMRERYGDFVLELRRLEPMPVAGAQNPGYIATLFVGLQ